MHPLDPVSWYSKTVQCDQNCEFIIFADSFNLDSFGLKPWVFINVTGTFYYFMTILWEYTVTIMTFLNSSLHFQLINELCGVWVCLLTLITFTIITIKIDSLQVSKMRRSLQLSVSSATRTGKFCFSVKNILAWIYSTTQNYAKVKLQIQSVVWLRWNLDERSLWHTFFALLGHAGFGCCLNGILVLLFCQAVFGAKQLWGYMYNYFVSCKNAKYSAVKSPWVWRIHSPRMSQIWQEFTETTLHTSNLSVKNAGMV